MHEFKSFLQPTILKFINFMTASQRWNNSYEEKIGSFDKFLEKQYPDANELTQDMVDIWCSKRPTEKINSCLARTNAVVTLIRYMNKRGLAKVKEPDRPKPQKCTHIPHAFTTEELTRFFYECDHIKIKENSKVSLIIKLILCVIFRLMYCTGLRPNEARQLKRSEVDLVHGVLNIAETKGHNQHYVAIHESMVEILKEYDRRMEELIPGRVYFFPSGKDGYYSKHWLQEHFSDLWRKANPDSHAISYDFRHNYATTNINTWKEKGFDVITNLYYLSKSMGHCNIEHTKYYYSMVPHFAEILEEKSGAAFDELMPEVKEYEEW